VAGGAGYRDEIGRVLPGPLDANPSFAAAPTGYHEGPAKIS